MASVLFPLPDHDFDVTEVAVPWKLLREAGHEVVFATEAGATPACDPLLITGVVFGKLGARPEAIAFYREMEKASRKEVGVFRTLEEAFVWLQVIPLAMPELPKGARKL